MPTAIHERVNLSSVPVNLTVMAEVGRQETPVFTWNPVEQMWIQEKGAAAKAPPPPNDIHAIQTWFLDTDENEWIQTVLGPMGRELAAQWRGAHRVPDSAIAANKAKPTGSARRSPLPFLVSAAVLIVVLGGAAVASSKLLAPAPTAVEGASPPADPSGTGTPAASTDPAPSASAAASADPTANPTSAPNATPRPRTPAPTAPPTPRPATPPPDFASPQVGPAGTTFHLTFTGLPAAASYRTSYTRGSVTVGYITGEVPSNGTVTFDLRTTAGSFPPDTYFFTIRAGNSVRTVTFRIS